GLEIKPGETVTLKPGGYHLMFLDLKAPLKKGEPVKGTLSFERAGTVAVEFGVEGMGAQAPAAGEHIH
ncbi:copper chaperone PCu(A)C, partial [Methylobacterium longum]